MSGLHRCQSSLLPKAIEPYPNKKEEGRNKAEKELLAVAHHELTSVILCKGDNVTLLRSLTSHE